MRKKWASGRKENTDVVDPRVTVQGLPIVDIEVALGERKVDRRTPGIGVKLWWGALLITSPSEPSSLGVDTTRWMITAAERDPVF
jgi:hypothetical protein